MVSNDFSHDLGRHIAATTFESLPADAVERAKQSILDLLGVCLAAAGTIPAIRGVMEIVRANGGARRASVLGFGDRTSPLMAAFANGAMAHCLDFDDVAPDGNHASACLIPGVFAAAEHRGRVSGKEIITAVALGQDIFLRIRRSLAAQRMDWLATTVIGVFSSTAGVARVLGLDGVQAANALGIASLGSCGTLEMRFGTGSDLGELYAGFVAKSAVLSAMMAQTGITGLQSVFEGQAGIMNVYFGGAYDRARVLDGLGERFEGADMQFKPWPVCGIANTYIQAMTDVVREHRLTSKQILEIRPYVGDFQQRMSYPLEERRRPRSAMDARFSLPFILAVAVVHGEVGIPHFTEEAIADPAVLALAARVVPVDDRSFDWTSKMPEARIDVVTPQGVVTGLSARTPGSSECPMEWDDIARKFRACAAAAPRPPASEVVERAIAIAQGLEASRDGTELIRLLS